MRAVWQEVRRLSDRLVALCRCSIKVEVDWTSRRAAQYASIRLQVLHSLVAANQEKVGNFWWNKVRNNTSSQAEGIDVVTTAECSVVVEDEPCRSWLGGKMKERIG